MPNRSISISRKEEIFLDKQTKYGRKNLYGGSALWKKYVSPVINDLQDPNHRIKLEIEELESKKRLIDNAIMSKKNTLIINLKSNKKRLDAALKRSL